MKKLVYILMVPLMIAASSVSNAQDYAEARLGLPGDNLNLFAVMKLFQESETLEGFERTLNDQDSRINNLDLNGDNYIDYIRVIDQPDGNVHVIVLQVAINARENQDVAVFIVQQEANNQVRIQLIGDEALYGKNYIVEPNYEYAGETPNPGYTGRTTVVQGQTVVVNRVTTVEVAAWPLIRFMFLPTYVVWHSPWYWGYYPRYWRPWTPHYWHYYYGYHYNWYPHYYGYYRHYNDYRYPRYHSYYYGSRRNYSPYVATNISRGTYRTTYSRPETRQEGSRVGRQAYATTARRDAGTSSRSQQVSKSTSTQGSSTTTTRRANPTRSTEATTGRATSTRSTETTTGRSTSTRSTGATTGRSSNELKTTQGTVNNANRRSSTDSRVNSAPERKSTQTTTSRPSSPRQSSGSNVRTETKRTTSGSSVGNGSSSRRSSGSTESRSSGRSSGSEKSDNSSKRTSSGRR
ncbi:MAG: hypothetical protein JW830_12790 [Bacteroidales bacterium]|nr:hypothetical protein [Bacteroidales bacterium]